MKRTFRSWISGLLLALVMSSFVCGIACAATIPEHTSNFYVNDFAGVFTDEQIKVMMDKAVKLCEEYDGAQVVITTISSLEGETVENYANQMYNKYKIGKDSMGVLVLMSVNDGKIRVEIGRNMQAYIPDSEAAKLKNTYAIPKLKQDKFAEGLMALQDALITEIMVNFDVTSAKLEKDSLDATVIGGYVLAFCGFILPTLALIIIKVIEYNEKKQREKTRKWLHHMFDTRKQRYRYRENVSRRSTYSPSVYYDSSSYSTEKSSSSSQNTSSNNLLLNSIYYDNSHSSGSFDDSISSSSFDDSSSYSGFDGCSDGGGASGDF